MTQVACFAIPPENPEEAWAFWAYPNLTVHSFKREIEGLRAVLITSADAVVPKGLAFDAVHRVPDDSGQATGLMIAELRSWHHFTESNLFDRPTILIDPDLILVRNPFDVFDGSFDVGLTWRELVKPVPGSAPGEIGDQQPINAGVVFLNADRPEKVAEFMRRCYEDLLTLEPHYWRWYGDQESLLRASGMAGRREFDDHPVDVDGIRVRFLPCARYNYSPLISVDGEFMQFDEPDPMIVHFKGERKRHMHQYAIDELGMRMKHDNKAPGNVRIFPNKKKSATLLKSL
mgnify:CR=1 FL=1